MGKDLKEKAIDIKGKKYVLVSDRVIYFNETYPNGSITTKLVSDPESELVVVKATVTPDVDVPTRTFSDYSQAIKGDGMVNKTAALENASTSAVGRSLAYMGIGVIDSIASVDEINKASASTGLRKSKPTDKQLAWMLDEAERKCGQEDAYEWLTKLLTVKPEDVPSYKVKDAIDLIRKQSTLKKPLANVDISEDDLKKIDEGTLLNDLPY